MKMDCEDQGLKGLGLKCASSRFLSMLMLLTVTSLVQAALPVDPIQHCLDVRRLADFSSRQKMAAKEPGVLPFKFHKIASWQLPLERPVGNMDEVIQALTHQINQCNKHSGVQKITIAGHSFKQEEWCLKVNQKMLQLAKAAQGNFEKYLSSIKTEFDWYQSEGWPENHSGFKKGIVQFTAYYAPSALEARTRSDGTFIYPIHSNPGVVQVVSESKKFKLKTSPCGYDPLTKMARGYCLKHADGTYSVAPDREEIAKGALDAKYVIGYVKDPNDPAFLMLQGSGSLILDGKLFHINYDGANGRPRTMLGRIIQCAQDPSCGGNLDTMEACAKNPKCHDAAKLHCNLSKEVKLSGASEKFIRQYLNNPRNRDKADSLRYRDQSYVFFVKEEGGPYGSENIPLTPHVSCATDHRVIPIGMNFIYHCKNTTSWCLSQDTGGAIVGAHVDVYKGEGEQAGVEANGLNHGGSLFIALPKT